MSSELSREEVGPGSAERRQRLRGLFSRCARLAVLGFFLVVTVYPLLFVLMTSLKSNKEFYSNFWLPSARIEWENYAHAWHIADLGIYLQNSVIVVTFSVALTLIISLTAGYSFARLRPKGSGVLFAIMLATLMVPGEVTLIPLFRMMRALLNTRLSLILVYGSWAVAISTYIFRNFFISIPDELGDAARIDGCSEWGIFLHIMIPLTKPVLATVIILDYVSTWGEFLWALVAVTKESIKTLPLGLFVFQSQYNTDWGPLSAGLCISIAPLIAMCLLLQRFFIRGLTAGAIKA